MILNVVVGPSVEVFCDFGPTISVFLVELENLLVFLFCPTVFLDVGIQMVVPTFTTLLTDATFQIMSDLRPVLSPVNFNLVHE